MCAFITAPASLIKADFPYVSELLVRCCPPAASRFMSILPGFVHAKEASYFTTQVVNTIGTVNGPTRSLFLHFEKTIPFFYRSVCIAAINNDFIATQAKCKEVKPYDMKHYLKCGS